MMEGEREREKREREREREKREGGEKGGGERERRGTYLK